ncbi:MAG: hypothetical protein WCE27_18215 [Pseudolabrys sp.]
MSEFEAERGGELRQGFLRTLSVGLLAAGAFVDPAARKWLFPTAILVTASRNIWLPSSP